MRVIVKIGSNVLTPNGVLDTAIISMIAQETCCLMKNGHQILVVTSGAVSTGMSSSGSRRLKCSEVTRKQIHAAIGQPKLMASYAKAFESQEVVCSQILLTRRDFEDGERRKTLLEIITAMLSAGIVPILNENDAITAEELQNIFTDNDQLAALVAMLMEVDKLVILSDVPGFLRNPDDPSTVIPVIDNVDDYLHLIDPSAGNGRGGMRSKLETAGKVTDAGTEMFIASGLYPGVLTAIMNGEQVGTRFPAKIR